MRSFDIQFNADDDIWDDIGNLIKHEANCCDPRSIFNIVGLLLV